jgi:hypothetical protein
MLLDQVKDDGDGTACNSYGREEECMQSYGGKIRRKETTGKTKQRWEYSIKIEDLREVGLNSMSWIHLTQWVVEYTVIDPRVP